MSWGMSAPTAAGAKRLGRGALCVGNGLRQHFGAGGVLLLG